MSGFCLQSCLHRVTVYTEESLVSDVKGDAINALVSLGYSQNQANTTIKSVYQENMSSESLIREALKAMI